jgi:membrane protein DedA with SNARE-associated domain
MPPEFWLLLLLVFAAAFAGAMGGYSLARYLTRGDYRIDAERDHWQGRP